MINYFIDKYALKVKKVTKKGDLTILETESEKFVFKQADIKIYNYLLSRGFDYYPMIIDYHDNIIMFKYIENIDYDKSEKSEDYIKLLSLLHLKTSYYKNIDLEEFKSIYNELYNKLINLNNYYNSLILNIESKEYMSPSEYLISRNISNIFLLINNSFKLLEDWYNNIKNNTKKRVVTLYNNINLDNMLKSTSSIYFTSFDNTKVDLPIYDLYQFYDKYCLDYDFLILLKKYEKVFKLSKDELDLLKIYIGIPDKIKISNKINDISIIKKSISKLYTSINILNFKKEEETNAHEDKVNK